MNNCYMSEFELHISGEAWFFSKWCWDNRLSIWKNEIGTPISYNIQKGNSKLIRNLNMEDKTIQLWWRDIGHFHYTGLQKDSFYNLMEENSHNKICFLKCTVQCLLYLHNVVQPSPLIPEYFIIPPKKPYPISNQSNTPFLHPLVTTNLLSLSGFAYYGHYKWNHPIYDFLCLVSFI